MWFTVPLKCDYRIEYLPSKTLVYSDDLCRLIPRNNELIDYTVMTTLKIEADKSVMWIFVCGLPVTMEEICVMRDLIVRLKENVRQKRIKQALMQRTANMKACTLYAMIC